MSEDWLSIDSHRADSTLVSVMMFNINKCNAKFQDL